MSKLPSWLWPNSNNLSPFYKRIWEAVQEDCWRLNAVDGEILVDTNKIFSILLTSQLPTEVLGYIWNLANQKYAGQLTEQELYIVLALVALAQASYPFNSLEVLNYIDIPPIPNLNLTFLGINEMKVHISPFESPSLNSSSINKKYGNLPKLTNTSINLNNDILSYSHNLSDKLRDVQYFCGHESSYSSNVLYDDHQNLHIQSNIKHQASCYSIDFSDDFSDFQSAPISNVSNISNIWDSKQGSAIGSRLANHNLGIKKLNDKIRKTGLSKSNNNNQVHHVTTSNLILQNKEIQSNDSLLELFPKCAVKKQTETVLLKDTAIRNNDSIEVLKSNIKDFTNDPKKIIINKMRSLPKSTYIKNIDLIYVTPLKILQENSIQQDLMGIQPTEDKYSALRALINEPLNLPSSKSNIETKICLNTDDFGDFVSAKHLIKLPVIENSDKNNSIDLLSDFNLNSKNTIGINNKSSPSLIQEISDAFTAPTFEETVDQQIEEKFHIFNTEKFVQKKDIVSLNRIELDSSASEFITQSGSVPNLNLKSFLPSSQEDKQEIENMYQIIYWEWKRYMKSCIFLLQVAADIFTNITSEIVLREVLSSAQGYDFLCNLAEVAAVCRRVNFSHKEMDINVIGFDDLLIEIDQIWSKMEPFYSNIPIVTELPAWPLHQGNDIICALCLTIITRGTATVNDNNYHATCANLWLHTVNSNLPAFQYPVSYIHSTIFQSENHS